MENEARELLGLDPLESSEVDEPMDDSSEIEESEGQDQEEQPANDINNEDSESADLHDDEQSSIQTENKILGKFKTIGAVAVSAGELAKQLGRNFNPDDYKTDDDLITAYRELERDFSRRGILPDKNPTTPQQSNGFDEIKQQLANQQQSIEKMLTSINQEQTPQKLDVTKISREDFLNRVVEDPAFMWDYMNAAGEQVGQIVNQMIQPMAQQYRQNQEQLRYTSVVQNVANRHEDFNKYARQVYDICLLNPRISQTIQEKPELGEECLELAYKMAKMEEMEQQYQALLSKQAEDMANQAKLEIDKQKKGARLPGQSGGNAPNEQQQIDERTLARQMLGLK